MISLKIYWHWWSVYLRVMFFLEKRSIDYDSSAFWLAAFSSFSVAGHSSHSASIWLYRFATTDTHFIKRKYGFRSDKHHQHKSLHFVELSLAIPPYPYFGHFLASLGRTPMLFTFVVVMWCWGWYASVGWFGESKLYDIGVGSKTVSMSGRRAWPVSGVLYNLPRKRSLEERKNQKKKKNRGKKIYFLL